MPVIKTTTKTMMITMTWAETTTTTTPAMTSRMTRTITILFQDDVIKCKHFSLYWRFVRGIHPHRWIPLTKACDAELWFFFFDLRMNKRLSKQMRRRWFEMPSFTLWRHCNVHCLLHQFQKFYIMTRHIPWFCRALLLTVSWGSFTYIH